jgi:hypothetical protein
MVEKIAHGFGAGGHVWGDAFSEASTFVCCAVQPLVRVRSTNHWACSYDLPVTASMTVCAY